MRQSGAVSIALCVLLSGCISSGGAPRVQTTVRAEPSGVNLVFADVGGQSRILVEIRDYTGTNERLSWQIPNIQLTPAYRQLVACVEGLPHAASGWPGTDTPGLRGAWNAQRNVREKQQAPDKSVYTQPHFLRTASLHCVEMSGMPPPEVIAEPDATEYRVSITVGILGARRRLRLTATNARPVATDVEECMRAAEKKGVAIQSLLARFDVCLRTRAYIVDDAPRTTQPK